MPPPSCPSAPAIRTTGGGNQKARLRQKSREKARGAVGAVSKKDGRLEALLRFGNPRTFNTDRGSTFTAEAFTSKLVTVGVEISMDGRGRFMDNIFIERLWRSIKYEEVHLKAYADGREAVRHQLLGELLQSCITTPICLCR